MSNTTPLPTWEERFNEEFGELNLINTPISSFKKSKVIANAGTALKIWFAQELSSALQQERERIKKQLTKLREEEWADQNSPEYLEALDDCESILSSTQEK